MRLRFSLVLIASGLLGTLSGCSDYQHAERPPWRAQAEEACLAKGIVTESASIRPFHAMSGPGLCGAVHPFKVTALDGGSVALNATQTLDCPMIAALDDWVRDVVQPAAEARFGERVVGIDSMGSYNCRGINNRSGAGLSEHAFANAIDVGGFTLASGRTLTVMKGFNGPDEQERAFLHEAHAGACGHFTTVLGPGYNVFHYNHFHLDLALHGSTSRGPRRYCKPVPQTNLPGPPVKDTMPDPPAIDEEMDIARAPLPEPAYRAGPSMLVASAPPPVAEMSSRVSHPAVAAMALAPVDPPPAPHGGRLQTPAQEPLISFGGEAPDESAPPPARPTRPVALAPVQTWPVPRAQRAARQDVAPPTGGDDEGEAAAKPADTPKDWDLTSSIGH